MQLLPGGSVDILSQDVAIVAIFTSCPMPQGFMYLVAIIDWYSRYVISWELSNTLDADFCIHALNRALKQAEPEIFNTDQGCQFTSHDFLAPLQEREIRISMDGKGRALDNILP